MEGLEPAGEGVGSGGAGTEEALATMNERGTAVGFSDTKEKEGVGNEEPEMEPEILEPAPAPEEAPVEAALAEGVEAEGEVVEVDAAALAGRMS